LGTTLSGVDVGKFPLFVAILSCGRHVSTNFMNFPSVQKVRLLEDSFSLLRITKPRNGSFKMKPMAERKLGFYSPQAAHFS
jgi:hypothetical protein